MGRKSKQAGTGHYPMTHHERTKKFASSSYGTTTTRLAGDTQVAFGSCSLSLTPIMDHTSSNGEQKGKSDSKACAGSDTNTSTTIAMVTPSGHLYAKQAIYEYLLTKTKESLRATTKTGCWKSRLDRSTQAATTGSFRAVQSTGRTEEAKNRKNWRRWCLEKDKLLASWYATGKSGSIHAFP